MKPSLPVDLEEFGARLEWAIDQAGMPKGEFAASIEKSPQQLSNWLKLEEAPSEAVIQLLSERLEVPRHWLRYGVVAAPSAPAASAASGAGGAADEGAPTREFVKTEIERYKNSRGGGIDWVPRLIEKVIDSGDEGRVKLALIEAIIAGGRNQTHYGEAMAAVQRGVVLEGEATAANGRNAVSRYEAEEARRRREGPGERTVEETLEAGRLAKPPEGADVERAG